jgi:hypothetical protein
MTGAVMACQAVVLSSQLAWPHARVKDEFDPNSARFAHDEMDPRPLTRELRNEFHNSIGDCEGKMMKADLGAPVERDHTVWRLDPS